MALTADISTDRYGTPDGHQPQSGALGANVTVYRGSVAAISGGTTTTKGYIKNMATPASTDLVVGIVNRSIDTANTAPGIAGTTADGGVHIEIETGTFVLASGTGADALTVATNGLNCYLIDEKTVGATNGSSSRPVAGLQVADPTTDPTIPTGFVAVTLGTTATHGGSP
jgi:hypothetical protein